METMKMIKEMSKTEFVYYSIDEMLDKFKEMIMEEEECI